MEIMIKIFKGILLGLIVFLSFPAAARVIAATDNAECDKLFDQFSINRIEKKLSLEESLSLWKKNKKACESNGSYQYYLAYIYGIHGRYLDSIKILDKYINKDNYDIKEHKRLLSNMYAYADKLDKAKTLADAMVKDYPDWYGGYYSLGIYYLKINNVKLAKENLSRAIYLNKNDPYVYPYVYMIGIYLQEQNYENAIKCYDKFFATNAHIAVTHTQATAEAIIACVKANQLIKAKHLILYQEKYNKNAEKCELFKEAKALYEQVYAKNGYSFKDILRNLKNLCFSFEHNISIQKIEK